MCYVRGVYRGPCEGGVPVGTRGDYCQPCDECREDTDAKGGLCTRECQATSIVHTPPTAAPLTYVDTTAAATTTLQPSTDAVLLTPSTPPPPLADGAASFSYSPYSCADVPRPAESQTCTQAPCAAATAEPYSWVASEWASCTATCGTGVRIRFVYASLDRYLWDIHGIFIDIYGIFMGYL